MKRWISFSFLLVLVIAMMFAAQRSRVDAQVGLNALLYLVADSERELTRMPARFTRLPDSTEIKAGKDLAKEYSETNAPKDAEIEAAQEYVSRVGRKLQPFSQRKLPYEFHYIHEPGFINAFALPGGQVYIGDGLLSMFDTEDELASVLAHEMEHVDHYHCAERLQLEAALRKLPVATLLRLPIEVFQAGYSKDQELEADREGALLMSRAGYSPVAMLTVMQKFARLYEEVKTPPRTVIGETERVARETLEGYFRSHPQPSERIAEVNKVVAAHGAGTLNERPFGISYIYLARRAERELEQKHFDAAIQFANRALEQQPAHERALYVRATAKLVTGNVEDAASDYHKLTSTSSPSAGQVGQALLVYSESLVRDGKWNDALDVANRMQALQPNAPGVLALKIRALVYLGRQHEALDATAALRKLYASGADELVTTLDATGRNELSLGHYADAVLALDFIAHSRNSAPDWRALGRVYFSMGRFNASADSFERALQQMEIDALDTSLFQNFADALVAAKQKNALVRFDASAKRDARPEHAGVLTIERLGLRVAAGEGTAAMREWQSQLIAGTLPPESAERLAWWYLRAQQAEQAEAILRQALAARPSHGGLRYALLWTELELGQQPEVRAAVETESLLGHPPLQLSSAMANAISEWRKKNYDKAIAQFDAATISAPEWRNAAWRDPLQPHVVAGIAGEMQAESDHRRVIAANRFRK